VFVVRDRGRHVDLDPQPWLLILRYWWFLTGRDL
jgi:hypothetical protein